MSGFRNKKVWKLSNPKKKEIDSKIPELLTDHELKLKVFKLGRFMYKRIDKDLK